MLAALSDHSLDAPLWRRLYTAEEAAAAVARCTIVSYGEKIDAMGLARITAHASGYGIGAANWVVQVRLWESGPIFSVRFLCFVDHTRPRQQYLFLCTCSSPFAHCSHVHDLIS